MRGRRCVRRGRGGARGSCSSLLMLRLRGRGCHHRSRNDKNCHDACVPLGHDTHPPTSPVNARNGVRVSLAKARSLLWRCDKFADHLLRIACPKIRPSPAAISSSLFVIEVRGEGEKGAQSHRRSAPTPVEISPPPGPSSAGGTFGADDGPTSARASSDFPALAAFCTGLALAHDRRMFAAAFAAAAVVAGFEARPR